jgi:transcriptional regulator with XRE-family HTH domain
MKEIRKNNMKKRRVHLGLYQREIAEKANISLMKYKYLESNLINIRDEDLEKFSQIFGVSKEQLFD